MTFKLLRLAISGCGPFIDRQTLTFGDHITLVTGQGGSGKSTLVRALEHAIDPAGCSPPRASHGRVSAQAPDISVEMEWDGDRGNPADVASLIFVEMDTLRDRIPEILDEFFLRGIRIPFPAAFREFSRHRQRSALEGKWEFEFDERNLQDSPHPAFYRSGDDTDFSAVILNVGSSEVSTLCLGMFVGIRSYLRCGGLPLVLCESFSILDDMHRGILHEWLRQYRGQVVIIDTAMAWERADLGGCTRYRLEMARDGYSRIVRARPSRG